MENEEGGRKKKITNSLFARSTNLPNLFVPAVYLNTFRNMKLRFQFPLSRTGLIFLDRVFSCSSGVFVDFSWPIKEARFLQLDESLLTERVKKYSIFNRML